jgi:cytochrome c peroxidase
LRKERFKYSILIFSITIYLFSFTKDSDGDLFSVPSNFPKTQYNFSTNPLTKEGVELGKALFYDAILSQDNSLSCGSCHQQSAGFVQFDHALSHGVNDHFTKRNSMPLANMAWSTSFGWDGGVHELNLFAVSPITNPLEMAETMPNVLNKIRKTATYGPMFKSAFGSEEVTTERFLKALSQFMLTMVSANSRYDKYMRMEGVEFTDTEKEGLEIFKQKCASCHSGELFTDFSFRNNGLKTSHNPDLGRFDVTQDESDKYKFKVPSLRNLSFTPPYMHDGRLQTLEQVLELYNSKVENSEMLDPILKQNGNLGIKLSQEEKVKILAFLKTLDDPDFITNPKFSENTLSFTKKETNLEIMDLKITDEDTKTILNQSLESYFKIKKAIFEKNIKTAAKQAEILPKVLSKVNISRLSEAQKKQFHASFESIAFNSEHIIEGKKQYSHQVDHFNELSKSVYKMMSIFKPFKGELYYYSCSKSGQNWMSFNKNEFSLVSKENCDSLRFKSVSN